MHVRFSKAELEYLAFCVSRGEGRDAGDVVKRVLASLAESEGAHCLDPRRSEFRAWLVKRDPNTRTERCCVRGAGYCSACVANFAADGIKVKAARPARAVAA